MEAAGGRDDVSSHDPIDSSCRDLGSLPETHVDGVDRDAPTASAGGAEGPGIDRSD
jgi:hypothetical protein